MILPMADVAQCGHDEGKMYQRAACGSKGMVSTSPRKAVKGCQHEVVQTGSWVFTEWTPGPQVAFRCIVQTCLYPIPRLV